MQGCSAAVPRSCQEDRLPRGRRGGAAWGMKCTIIHAQAPTIDHRKFEMRLPHPVPQCWGKCTDSVRACLCRGKLYWTGSVSVVIVGKNYSLAAYGIPPCKTCK
jgi:hypothetical protein